MTLKSSSPAVKPALLSIYSPNIRANAVNFVRKPYNVVEDVVNQHFYLIMKHYVHCITNNQATPAELLALYKSKRDKHLARADETHSILPHIKHEAFALAVHILEMKNK